MCGHRTSIPTATDSLAGNKNCTPGDRAQPRAGSCRVLCLPVGLAPTGSPLLPPPHCSLEPAHRSATDFGTGLRATKAGGRGYPESASALGRTGTVVQAKCPSRPDGVPTASFGWVGCMLPFPAPRAPQSPQHTPISHRHPIIPVPHWGPTPSPHPWPPELYMEQAGHPIPMFTPTSCRQTPHPRTLKASVGAALGLPTQP